MPTRTRQVTGASPDPDGPAAASPPEPRVVVITGATGALGRTAAAAFAADGARLGLVGTDRARLDALAAELGLDDDRWAPGVGDLRQAGTTRDAIGGIAERFGRVDVVLHLVGGWTGGTPVADLDPDVLEDMLARHLWSTLHVAQAVTPGMTERGWGRFVAVTSSATAMPGPKSSAYVVAKTAQEALLRVLAREVAGTGVTVNVLAVKAIDAARTRETDPSPLNASWATPEEIVAAMRYLCSDEAAAVNGARIPLDGR